MATVLGAPIATIGLVEGIAEAAAAITRAFSGSLSDYLPKRKPLVVLGYGLAAVTKPVFPLSDTIGWVFVARFVDRIGKGIRGAPRDALVADITPDGRRGAAYGLRQSLDSVGAFVGPLIAVVCMAWLANDIRAVLWVAVIPAAIAVAVLIIGVREPAAAHGDARKRESAPLAHAGRLPRRYWFVVLVGIVFTLARFSEAFLVLRAQDVGLALGYVPIVLMVMSAIYAGTAYPAGIVADRFSRREMLLTGLAILTAADIVLAVAASPVQALVGAGLWGLHMGMTQGLLSKLVADAAPASLRGTAFGLFNLAVGGALLLASVIAGALWSLFGPTATFVAGAAFAAMAAVGLLAGGRRV